MRVSRRVPTLSRFPAVAGHLNRDLLCPCRRGPMPRWCGVAALAAVCEIKPGSRPGGNQVQREWTRAGVVNHGLWTYNPAAVRNFSESVRICPSKKSWSICQYSEPFYSDRLGRLFCPGSRPGRNAETGTEGNYRMRCVLSRRHWRVGGASPQKYWRRNGSPHSPGPEVAALYGVEAKGFGRRDQYMSVGEIST